jgi:cytochrome P450
MDYIQPETRPLDSNYLQDPHPTLARIRAELPAAPVAMPRGDRAWLVTRYDDVRAALADQRLYRDFRKNPGGAFGPLGTNMLSTDLPDHTRLRKLIAGEFTARGVERLRPRIASIAAELLDAMDSHDEVDLIAAFSLPLAATVICELLGVPPADRDKFRAWSGNILSATVSPATASTASEEMAAYFANVVDERRQSPRADDLTSALIHACDEGDRLTEHEVVSMLLLLIVAGHDTTVNLIASGVLALLTHPGSWSRLRAQPESLPTAVEELLRFTSPVNHATFRFTGCPVAIGNVLIPKQETVLAVLGSANRDPSRFASPDALDLDRDASGHMAFGHGIHYCLGAPLARLEGVIAFGMLVSRFPEMSLAVPVSSLRWRESTQMRGLETLPVRLRHV